jgi:hypothetical protein
MRALLTLAVVGMSLMTVAPGVLAVHGSPYTAYGIAVRDNMVFDATVHWTGWWTRSYVVTITELTGTDVVGPVGFPGYEQLQGGAYYWGEFFWYHGYSLDPTHDFDITGIQTINFNTGAQHMLYTGNYGPYELVLIVDGS